MEQIAKTFKNNYWALALMDASLSVLVLWVSVSLRNESWFIPQFAAIPQILIALIGAPLALGLFGCYRSLDISVSYQNALTIGKAVILFGTAFLAASLYLHPTGIPRSVGIIYPSIFLLAVVFFRLVIEQLSKLPNNPGSKVDQKKVYIYGAGQAGKSILAFLRNQPWKVEAFLDDNKSKVGRVFHHLTIRDPKTIGPAYQNPAKTVLLALPSIDGSRRGEIYEYLHNLGYEVLTVPTLAQMAFGDSKFVEFRGIKIEDLLERSVVNPDIRLMTENVADKVVLVTGAGGSIGSELSRQILRLGARLLILFDHSEFHLFQINRKLAEERAAMDSDCRLISVLGSVCSEVDISAIFEEYNVEVVFHAAAYKHVHLLQTNEFRGIYNNVMGTRLVVNACMAKNVEKMVLVSTDKAVSPTSVMGMSKRISELIIEDARLNSKCVSTKFTIVRFGNVLGSNGSVIPIFEEQIANGGPVTVTHPDVTRYFMTIPEAASLVIQASALSEDVGCIFVLDMGKRVQISLLAERLIEMSGMRPTYAEPRDAKEIQIVFTALQSGEKLHEELFASSEDARPTEHPMIMGAGKTKYSKDLSSKLNKIYSDLEVPQWQSKLNWRLYLTEFLTAVEL